MIYPQAGAELELQTPAWPSGKRSGDIPVPENQRSRRKRTQMNADFEEGNDPCESVKSVSQRQNPVAWVF